MTTPRRVFLHNLGLATALSATVRTGGSVISVNAAEPLPALTGDRADWVRLLRRVSEPVIGAIAANQLKARMPVEAPTGKVETRRAVTHLEAFGRTVCGIAPWLALAGVPGGEAEALAAQVRRGLDHATNPAAADFLNFTEGGQPLVDAAFLGYGLLLAPDVLWAPLTPDVRARIVTAMQATRRITPGNSNWLLFSAMVEAFLARVGAEWQAAPIDHALTSHEAWYKGDGAYGDGPAYHWDYYNSYVIQPFLLTVLLTMRPIDARWEGLTAQVQARAARYAAVQERMIAADGSFPPLGRSLAYRCGAFHHLAHVAWRGLLPPEVAPAQARGALTAVIRRTLEAAHTFDGRGWLRVGLAGAQPSLAEVYISTGSLYLCTLAFHPLGLPAEHTFWSGPAVEWTQRRIWAGVDVPADHALK